MKCKYTKKKIVESIKYRQKQFQMLNEAQSAILNTLEKQLSEIDMVSKSNILDKVQINDDGTLGAIAF